MTVTKVSIKPRRVTLTADGVLTDFDFDFKIFAEGEVTVYTLDLLDVATLQVITTDYTVAFDSEAETGTITFLTAPTDQYTVLMISNVDYEQSTDIPKGGGFSEPVVEKAYDLLAIQIQQLKDGLDRAVTLSDTSSLSSVTLPDADAGKALLWNATADGLENSTDNFNDIVTDAEAAAAAAAASAVAAAASETAADTSEINAAGSETCSQNWAQKAEDSPILVGCGGDGATDFSALHWANKAAASAASINLPTIQVGDVGKILEVNVAEDGYDLVVSSAGPSAYRDDFVNGDLAAGVLTVTHSLGQKIVQVQVFNNSDKMVMPDEITLTNTTTLSIDLSSFGALAGTWNVIVIG